MYRYALTEAYYTYLVLLCVASCSRTALFWTESASKHFTAIKNTCCCSCTHFYLPASWPGGTWQGSMLCFKDFLPLTSLGTIKHLQTILGSISLQIPYAQLNYSMPRMTIKRRLHLNAPCSEDSTFQLLQPIISLNKQQTASSLHQLSSTVLDTSVSAALGCTWLKHLLQGTVSSPFTDICKTEYSLNGASSSACCVMQRERRKAATDPFPKQNVCLTFSYRCSHIMMMHLK